jgi:hypothetical protein
MPYVSNRGNPANPCWIVLSKPYGSDIPAGSLLSGGLGHVYDKMFKEAGLNLSDFFICSRCPNSDDVHAFANVLADLQFYMPKFILLVDEVAGVFLPELRDKKSFLETSRGQLQKYAGSLLKCPELQHEHYAMPLYGPQYCIADWTERNITTYVDLQKMRDEIEYWKKNGALRALPERRLVYGNLEINEILQWLDSIKNSELISIDIETAYPRAGSAFLPHPGYPITIGLAKSATTAISFNLFRDNPEENRLLWRAFDNTIRKIRILGQNFFNFDALFLQSLGFQVDLSKVEDTLLRHHILWPELSHKLQFMTRQYTREPYYKDEGHHWSIKHMDRLRRYNCLDVCVTMEIYEAQEEEFKLRPQLR